MANQDQIQTLMRTVEELNDIDRDKLLRPELGEISLKEEIEPKLEILNKKIDLILQFASDVHGGVIDNINSILSSICQYMNDQCERDVPEYVAEKENFLSQFQAQFEEISRYWPNVITAAMEDRGFLEDEGIKKEYNQAIEVMKQESENALTRVKEEANKTIEEARTLAEEIENRARRTASGISVEAAQEQFRLAQQDHNKRVKLWSWLSGGAILSFFVAAVIFGFFIQPEGETKSIVYSSAVRITIVGALGGIIAFCLRILRAHMHLAQHNEHRQRVANSIEAFVESAITPEQRDLILAQLVDSIAHFGSSGILRKEDESIQVPKVVVDNLSRTITPSQTQPRQ